MSLLNREELKRQIKEGTFTSLEDAQIALTEFNDIGGKKYPLITRSWTIHWNELSIFFKYPDSVRKLIYRINPIESAFKMLYLSIQDIQEKWKRTSIRNWYKIYPQLSIFFSEIMSKYTK